MADPCGIGHLSYLLMHLFSLRHTSSRLGGVFALGNFDGVHLGHQKILQETVRLAHKHGRPSGCVVFEPHPQEYFRPHSPPFRLTSLHDKAWVLRALGLDVLGVMRFTTDIANLSAEEFIRHILLERLGASHLVVGADYRFGKAREGTAEDLCRMARPVGIEVNVVPLLKPESLSSSQIRQHLKDVEFARAAEDLGRWWWMSGRVGSGARRGMRLGFPTANIPLGAYLRLPLGVYAVQAFVLGQDQRFQGVANLGVRPTFQEDRLLLETHLFDCNSTLYGSRLLVFPLAFLRGERRFANASALKAQIAQDCVQAQAHIPPTRLWTTPPSPC